MSELSDLRESLVTLRDGLIKAAEAEAKKIQEAFSPENVERMKRILEIYGRHQRPD